MDELGYEWYTGFRTPRAVCEVDKEEPITYKHETEQAHVEQKKDKSCEERPKSPILFSGINVEISHEDQIGIIEEVNQAIEKWIPICMTSSRPVSPCNVDGVPKYDPDDCEVSTIKLQKTHHVTLFYYSLRDPKEELKDPITQKVLEQMGALEPGFKTLWNAVTPYEFAVALLYRHFYQLKMPFEDMGPKRVLERHVHASIDHKSNTVPKLTEDSTSTVPITLKHVIFVPGVLMCATAHLGRKLVPIPSPDGKYGPYCDYPRKNTANMDLLVKLCRDGAGLMLEENHCTHVTLGVTKDYTAVFSNNVCQGVKNYLAFLDAHKNGRQKLWYILKVDEDDGAREMKPRELLEMLEIYSSGPSKFKHGKRAFVELAPYLLRDDDVALEEAAKRVTFNDAEAPTSKHCDKYAELYRRTRCFVAGEGNWIYIRNLPINKDIGPNECEGNNMFADAYISRLDKSITGDLRFF
ncbi:high-affinity branched-chain amino acid transport ATP-binding, putative [Babesia ovis]|uniref:High-affinity branched-chain amino acid transport ATP-binding, putative n=1 Tax=Babesia ovis TaxID=5869 RepID=A0A9W5TD71_BABOV|nr:high-affinity branched-chain amino acid transport ATP-binding, putative [Babesia ovis]